MALTETEKKMIKLQAREIAFEVCKEALAAQIQMCPHGKALLRSKWMIVGIFIGSGIGGSGIGFTLAKLFAGI